MIGQINARRRLRTGAPWMLRRWASTFFESIGATLDVQAQRAMDGRLAAIPYAGADPGAPRLASGQRIECQPDALPYHATDRGISLYATEPVISQRVRLSQWRQLHARRGTHRGEMENLQPYFLDQPALPMIRIVHQAGDQSSATWHTLDPSGVYSRTRVSPSNWNFDNVPSKWSRFWVILYLPAGVDAGTTYDDGVTDYDDGVTVYDGLGAQQIADLISMIQTWKSAHSILWGFIVTSDPAMFDPTGPGDGVNLPAGNWGFTVDPFGNPTRPTDASWLLDLGQG